MNRRNLLVGILTAIVVTATAGIAQAEDACRANCDQWLAACKRTCADAPVPDECRANCAIADRQCLENCENG
jgi:hypothetical protein